MVQCSFCLFGANLLRKGIVWRIGNGTCAKFWSDIWSPCDRLLDFAPNVNSIDPNAVVQDFWQVNTWNLDMLKDNLPLDVAQRIISIPISQHGHVDKIIWGGTEVLLLVPSLLNMRTNSFVKSKELLTIWKEIWSLAIPPKLKVFLWSFVQGILLTNEQRFRRNIAIC